MKTAFTSAIVALAILAGGAASASAQTYGSGATTNCPTNNCTKPRD